MTDVGESFFQANEAVRGGERVGKKRAEQNFLKGRKLRERANERMDSFSLAADFFYLHAHAAVKCEDISNVKLIHIGAIFLVAV